MSLEKKMPAVKASKQVAKKVGGKKLVRKPKPKNAPERRPSVEVAVRDLKLYSTKEAAEELDVPFSTLQRYLNIGHPKAGKLGYTQVGGTKIVQQGHIDSFRRRLADN